MDCSLEKGDRSGIEQIRVSIGVVRKKVIMIILAERDLQEGIKKRWRLFLGESTMPDPLL